MALEGRNTLLTTPRTLRVSSLVGIAALFEEAIEGAASHPQPFKSIGFHWELPSVLQSRSMEVGDPDNIA